MDNTQIINDFITTFTSLIQNIASVCPTSVVGNNEKWIISYLKNNQVKILEVFCIKVLPYKQYIDDGEDKFFTDKDYSSDMDGDNNKMSIVNLLKDVWETLSVQNQSIVMMHMQILCELSLSYARNIM